MHKHAGKHGGHGGHSHGHGGHSHGEGGHPHGAGGHPRGVGHPGAESAQTGSAPLRLVAWETTRTCYLNCKHCRAAAKNKAYEGELTTEEGEKLIDNIASFSKPILILTGGEPMMRKDIFHLARYGTDKGLRVVMSPCGGLITPETAQQIKDSGIQRISISIDGATAEAHDAFRGVPGAFESTMKGLAIAREAGIEFQINTTVTKHNLNDLPKILDLAIELGAAAFDPFLLVPTGRGKELADMEITPAEYEKTLNWVYEKSKDLPIHMKPTCAPHYYRIIRQREAKQGRTVTPQSHGMAAMTRGCLGGQGFVFVSYKGEVQICGFLETKCGNVREENFDFKKIWDTSPVFLQMRNPEDYHGRCGVCEYHKVCGGCRARAFAVTSDYMGEEPYCVYMPPASRKSPELDDTDKQILDIIQKNFPIEERPYAAIANQTGLPETEILQRVSLLRKNGVIRRIGASLNPRKLGYTSTLVAAKVAPEKIDETVAAINKLPQVTHNYLREHEYNVWFTVIARSVEEIGSILDGLRKETGAEIIDLPATHTFKIDASMKLS